MIYQDIFPQEIIRKTKGDQKRRNIINVYKGCEFGCSFCIGRSERYWPEGGNVSFSDTIMVKKHAPELLRKELEVIKKKHLISLGEGMNDPYQPCEKDFCITRRCLEVIRDLSFPVHIMTRSTLIRRDMDLIKEISARAQCFITIAVSSADDSFLRAFEPKAQGFKERMGLLKEIRDSGIIAGIAFSPVMPYLNDEESAIEDIFKAAKDAGASFLTDSPLILEGYQKECFFSFMQKSAKIRRYVNRYQRLYRTGSTPSMSYVKKMNRIFFDMSGVYGISRSSPSNP